MKKKLLPLLFLALACHALAAPTLAPSTPDNAGAANLAQVLHIINKRSPGVQAAQANRRQADAQVQQARAAWFGKVDAYGQNQHFNDPRLTRPITQPPSVANYPFSSEQFGYGLDMQLPIDLSRQIAAEVDAAKSRATGARWSAEDVRLRALLQGAALYRNLEAMVGQRTALAIQLESLEASERVAQTGLKVGNIARVNLLRVQAAAAEVQAAIASIRGQEQKLRAQLAALMDVSAFVAPVNSPATGPNVYPTDSGRSAPVVLAAQNTLAASQAELQAAHRAQYPQLAINAGWNRNAIQWDQQPVNTWQVSLSVRMNLWSGGAQRSAIDAAQAAVDEANQRLRDAEANVRAAREAALAQWNAQDQSYRAAQSGLLSAEESTRIEQDRFRNGLGSATDLIDAEATLARARASVASALAGWWQADDALRYAYGEPPLAYADASATDSKLSTN